MLEKSRLGKAALYLNIEKYYTMLHNNIKCTTCYIMLYNVYNVYNVYGCNEKVATKEQQPYMLMTFNVMCLFVHVYYKFIYVCLLWKMKDEHTTI